MELVPVPLVPTCARKWVYKAVEFVPKIKLDTGKGLEMTWNMYPFHMTSCVNSFPFRYSGELKTNTVELYRMKEVEDFDMSTVFKMSYLHAISDKYLFLKPTNKTTC